MNRSSGFTIPEVKEFVRTLLSKVREEERQRGRDEAANYINMTVEGFVKKLDDEYYLITNSSKFHKIIEEARLPSTSKDK